MQFEQSQNLILDTFNYPFKEEKFYNLSINLFKNLNLDNDSKWQENSKLPDALRSNIQSFKILGNYKYHSGETILIAMIKLKDSKTVEKSRYLQRNFSKYLLEKNNADACLVSFFADDYEDWRFSLIKIDYKRSINQSGKINIKKDLTPVKRFSYLVGLNEPNFTAKSQLSPLLNSPDAPSIDELIKAFSIEKVTKEFFKDYKNLTYVLAGELKSLQSDKKIYAEFNDKKIDEFSFSKKIMSQLIFIYFLQKKGMLSFEKNKFKNLNGEKNFIKILRQRKGNFFNDTLEYLFYEGFLDEHNDNHYKKLNCFIPNISVSLFEPINNYDWKNTKINIKNEVFDKIIEVFDRYNFTVSEEQSFDLEVAVDPEMLGKVFESLIDDNIRKSTGAFYTPRLIVNQMCKKTIFEFLNNSNLEKKIVNLEKIFNLLLSDSGEDELLKIADNKILEKINNDLSCIHILDPAVGSGAFLVEMLSILSTLLFKLRVKLYGNADPFLIKRDIIKNNLYGSDIDASAIEIAKLRLWLSLIVSEDKIKNIEDLPNLDFKIVNINSLIIKQPDLLDYKSLKILDKLYKKYFDLKKSISRLKIKDEIKSFVKKNSIIPNLYTEFFNVFEQKKGFDIIIANPPYVGEKGNKEIFDPIKHGELKEFLKSKSDFFYYFIHLGIKIGNENCSLSYITTNYFFTATGASNLRKHIKSDTDIYQIINFNDLKIFESALGQSNAISFLSKKRIHQYCSVHTCLKNGIADNNILKQVFDGGEDVFVNKLEKKNVFDQLDDFKMNNVLSLENLNEYSEILEKLMSSKLNLGTVCDINSGAHVVPSKLTKKHIDKFSSFSLKNLNEGIFVLTSEEVRKLNLSSNEKKIVKKFIKSSDVEKFKIIHNDKFLIYTKFTDNINEYPNIKQHLKKYKVILDDQILRYKENMPWFALHRPGSFSIFQANEKIVAPYRCKSNIFGYTTEKLFSSNDNYYINLKNSFSQDFDLKYILGILNSELILFWLLKKGKRKGRMLELYPEPLQMIPINKSSEKLSISLIKTTEKIIKNNKDKKLFDELNDSVYKIYDFNNDQIRKIKRIINEFKD